MDCNIAKEKINIFDALDQDEKERVLAHAQTCESCRNELIYTVKLRDALAGLEELVPPLGLASSAIARAKKIKRTMPIAYLSFAAAAVIAVAFIASSGLLGIGKDNTANEAMEMAVNEDAMRGSDELAMKEAPMAEAAEMEAMADEAMAPDDVVLEAQPEATQALTMEAPQKESEDAMGQVDVSFIYVSADKTDFAKGLDAFFKEYDIYVEYTEFDGNTSMNFFVGELQYERFIALLEQSQIVYDSSLVPGSMVELTFVK